MELRKEWREVVEGMYSKPHMPDQSYYASRKDVDDLTLRLQALADKERREALRFGMLWDDGESLAYYTSTGPEVLPKDFDPAWSAYLKSQEEV